MAIGEEKYVKYLGPLSWDSHIVNLSKKISIASTARAHQRDFLEKNESFFLQCKFIFPLT